MGPCRALTQLHEEVVRGSAAEILAALEDRPTIKGEIVLVVGPTAGEHDSATP